MARIIKFPITPSHKIGIKKVRKRRKVNLEDLGQLNMFSESNSAKVIDFNEHGSSFDKALFYDEKGDPRATDFYLKAIMEGENKADAFCNLGILSSNQKEYTKAIEYFSNSLSNDPRHSEAHYNLANVYSEAGNLQLAKIHYELSIKFDPELVSAYYNLGLVLAMMEELTQAVQTLKIYKKSADTHTSDQVDKLISSLQKTIQNKAL